MLKNIDEIRKTDVTSAGGKGASLGELMNAGFLVPEGFVITSDVFAGFLSEFELKSFIEERCHAIDFSLQDDCYLTSQSIINRIMSQDISPVLANEILARFDFLNLENVAVRSSATSEDSIDAAWAGQLDTFLCVKRSNVLESVKKCWSSLYTERALVYRKERALLTQDVTVAVVIQKMVQSEISGTGFSVNPVTSNTNEIIIDAGFGLGEAIVSGQITPETYSVNKGTKAVINKKKGEQKQALYQSKSGGVEWRDLVENDQTSVLSEPQLHAIIASILNIEKYYGFPCDIEWAICDEKLFILQSRPITTLSTSNANLDTYFAEIAELRLSGRWSQPLLSCSFYVDWAETEFIKEFIPDLRFSAISYIDGHAFVSAKDEEQYLNYLITRYKNGSLADFSHQLDKVGQELYLKHRKFIEVHDDRKLDALKDMLKSHLEFQSFWNFEAIGGDLLLKLAKKVGYIDFDAQLFDKVNPFLRRTWIEEEHDHVISIARTIPADATNIKDLILHSKELIAQINEYLEKYSWIGTGNWQGEAYTIEVVVDKIIEEFQNLREDNNVTISTNSSDVCKQDPIVQLSVVTSYWRATCAGLTAKIENSYRSALRTLSENVGVAYEDLIFLTYKELDELITNPKAIIFDSKMKERKKEFFICKNDLEIFSVLVPSDAIYYHLKNSLIPNEFERVQVNELSGTGASGGIATGKAKIVFSRKDFNNFNEGEILIAPETTPAFVPIMRKAAAIITDRGGITSHAAIVGRELKKPVIIAVKNATKIIINDEALHVDAYKGIIKMTDRTTNL